MSLKHALLGILNYRPGTGYDLKRFFDQSVKHFWNAELSQIYRTLDQMQAEDLVTSAVEHQASRPSRRVYALTEAGRRELRRWLREAVPAEDLRSPYLVQLFFGASLPPDEVLGLLDGQREGHRARLQAYRGQVQDTLRKGVAESGLEVDGLFWQFTLDLGIKLELAWLDWCDDVRQRVEALKYQEGEGDDGDQGPGI